MIADDKAERVAILGAGPAGLTAAYELQRIDPRFQVQVYEASDLVGGISRTESHHGYRFDIGGHRFFTKVEPVEAMWREVLADDFIRVRRMSRIYYRGRYYDYPLRLFNALYNIGPYEAFRVMGSYAKWRMFPRREEISFEDWVINRFGGRLYAHFFRSYTEKVWGIPCREINADWAAQRIKNLSLSKAVLNALTGANDTASLIEEFDYPRLGPGMMWEAVRDRVRERGGEVHMRRPAVTVRRDGSRVTGIDLAPVDGEAGAFVAADHVINSMPLRELIFAFDPPPPAEVVAAAERLKYRDFLIVTLVLDHADPFPDNWIYVHSPEVKVGRIQNFRAWSPEMLPRPDRASIGMEYFCHEGDGLWAMADDDLKAMAGQELAKLRLARADSVEDGFVIRQRKAYPVYDPDYSEAVSTISEWIRTLENFQTVGRNGLHRYNNQDHSMLTAMLAAHNVAGATHDLWAVNVERAYHEEFTVKERPRKEIAA